MPLFVSNRRVLLRVFLFIVLCAIGLATPQLLFARRLFQVDDGPTSAIINRVWLPRKRIKPAGKITIGLFLRGISSKEVPFNVELRPIRPNGNLGNAVTGLVVRPADDPNGKQEIPKDENSEIFSISRATPFATGTYQLRVSQFDNVVINSVSHGNVVQITSEATLVPAGKELASILADIKAGTVVYTPVTALVIDAADGTDDATALLPSQFVAEANTAMTQTSLASRAKKRGPKLDKDKAFYVTAITDDFVEVDGDHQDLDVTIVLAKIDELTDQPDTVARVVKKLRKNKSTHTFKLITKKKLDTSLPDNPTDPPLADGKYRLTVVRNGVEKGDDPNPVSIEFIIK